MSCLDQPPDDAEWIVDNIFIKQMFIAKAGTMVPQHSHEYAHTSALAVGAVRVWKDEELLGDFHAPHMIEIPAHTKHRFQALVDNTVVYCIHNIERIGKVEIHEEHQLQGVS